MTVFRQKTHEVSMNEILHADRFSCALVFDACDRCSFGAVSKEGITPF